MSNLTTDLSLLNKDEGYFLVSAKVMGVSNMRRVPDGMVAPDVKKRLPPEVLVSPGQMRFVADKFFSPIKTFRNKVARDLQAIGAPYVSAHVIPFSSDDLLERMMGDLEAEMAAIAVDLTAQYPTAVSSWCNEDCNREFEEEIRKVAPPVGYIQDRIRFEWDVVGFGKADTAHPLLMRKAEERQKRLPEILLEDIADSLQRHLDAREQEQAAGRLRVSRKGLNPFKEIQKKLQSFSLLAPWAAPLSQYIERIVTMLDATGGSLAGDHRLIYMGLLTMLADIDSLKKFSEEILLVGVDSAYNLAINVSQPGLPLDVPAAPVVPVASSILPVSSQPIPSIALPGMAGLKPATFGRRVVVAS